MWHGICVAFWIIYANLLSYKLWFLDKNDYEEIEVFIKSKLKNITLWKLDFEEIYKYMKNDKKNETELVNFILLKNFGEVFEYKVTKQELREVFDIFMKI